MATQPKKERVLEIVYGDGRVSKLPMPTPSPLEAKPKRATRAKKVVKKDEPVATEEVKPKRTRTKKTAAPETVAAAPVVTKEIKTDITKVADTIIGALDPNIKRIVRNTSATASTAYKIDKNTKESSDTLLGMVEGQKESAKVQAELVKVVKRIEDNTGGSFLGDTIAKSIAGALGTAGVGAAGAAAAGAKALAGKAANQAGKAAVGEAVPKIAGKAAQKAEQEALKKAAEEALKKSEQEAQKQIAKRIGVKAAAKIGAKWLGGAIGAIGGTIVGSPIGGAAAAIALPLAIEAGFDYVFGADEDAALAPTSAPTPTPPTGLSDGAAKDDEDIENLFGAPIQGGVEITVPPKTEGSRNGDDVGLFSTPKAISPSQTEFGEIVGWRGEGGGSDVSGGGGGNEEERQAKLEAIRQERISQLENEIKQKEIETQKKFQSLNGDASSSEDTRDAMESQSALVALQEQLERMKGNLTSRIEDPKEAEELNRLFGKPLSAQAEILTKGLLNEGGKPLLGEILDLFKDLANYLAFGGAPGAGGRLSVPGGSTGGSGGSGAMPKVTGSVPAPQGLGSLSAQYESAKAGSAAIGNDSTGGYSYGKYQFATKRGSMQNFMNALQQKNPEAYAKLQAAGGIEGAKAGTPAFQAAWKEVSQTPGFAELEHEVIKQNNYDPAVSKMQDKLGFDPTQRSKTLQDVVWSTSVQHGGGGANDVFTSAQKKLGKPLSQATDDEIINAVYDVRPNFFSKSTDKEKASVAARFQEERKNALGMLSSEKTKPAMASVPTGAESASGATQNLSSVPNPAIPPVPEKSASQAQTAQSAPAVVNAPTTTNVINNGGGSQVAPVRLSSRNDENTVERLQAAYLYHGVIF